MAQNYGTPTFNSINTAPNVRCNGVADDTVALQAAIVRSQGSAAPALILPPGTCMISGSLAITAPINIRGAGTWGTVLMMASTMTSPAITVGINTSTFAPSNAGPADVQLHDFQITSPNRVAAAGVGLAHGIGLLNVANPAGTRVLLDDLLIDGVPGDGINALVFAGFVESRGTTIAYPGGYGVAGNSVDDWLFQGGTIYGAIHDNISLSGSSNFRFSQVNVFVADGADVHLFNTNRIVFDNCLIDLTGQDGVYVDNRTGGRLDFIGTDFRWSSTSANATYTDLHLSFNNTGNVYISSGRFQTPVSSPNANKPKNNIQFDGGPGLVIVSNVSFDAGAVTLSAVTNFPTAIIAQSPGLSIGSISGTLPPIGGLVVQGQIVATGLPTTCSAQPTGTIWKNGAVLNICP